MFPCPRFPPRHRAISKRSCETSKPGISLELQDHDPRDHSLLKEAFNAMLDVRSVVFTEFTRCLSHNCHRQLNFKILSFVPDLFNSLFKDVSISPICHAMLPPSSVVRELSDDVIGDMTESRCTEDEPFDMPGLFLQTTEELTVEYGGCLPLNSTINLVLACKDAVWEQFEVCKNVFT